MEKLLRPKTVCELLGISIPTLYRISKEPDFPSKVQISPQAVGWYESELKEWADSKKDPKSEMEIA